VSPLPAGPDGGDRGGTRAAPRSFAGDRMRGPTLWSRLAGPALGRGAHDRLARPQGIPRERTGAGPSGPGPTKALPFPEERRMRAPPPAGEAP
jgi:hypothetical protein